MNKNRFNVGVDVKADGGWCGMALAIPVILFFLFSIIATVFPVNPQSFEGTVEKTYVDGGDTYFVILKTGDTEPKPYKNEDNLFYWKFNSGNFLVGIEVGKTYNFRSIGWRIPVFSEFPNIVRYESVESDKK